MGVKTDYLKDCVTGKSVTVQELINLKNQVSTIPNQGVILNQVNESIQKIDATLQAQLEQTKEEIDDEVNEKIQGLITELNLIKVKLNEIYNKVVSYKFKTISKIERNMNNDITKIIFSDNSYIKVDYNNLPYKNEYINYMPSKLNYYDASDKLIAIEELDYQNESIIGFSNKNF